MILTSEENTSTTTFYNRAKETHNKLFLCKEEKIVNNDVYKNSEQASTARAYDEEGDSNEVVDAGDEERSKLEEAAAEAAMYAYEEECRAYEEECRAYDAWVRRQHMEKQMASLAASYTTPSHTGYHGHRMTQPAYPAAPYKRKGYK